MAKAKQDATLLLFEGKSDAVQATYDRLVEKLVRKVGSFGVEAKKTGLHLTNGSAFAGVHPKKNWLDLTLRLSEPLSGARVRSKEQVSRNRWHNEVRLSAPSEVDAELMSWLVKAHALGSERAAPAAKRKSG